MYYVPPRGMTQYADGGEPFTQWVAKAVPHGKVLARLQRHMSRLAPALLAAGFALQLWAAMLS